MKEVSEKDSLEIIDRIEPSEFSQETKREFRRGFMWGCLVVILAAFLFFNIWSLMWRGAFPWTRSDDEARLTDLSVAGKLQTVQYLISKYYFNDADGEMLENGLFKGIAAGLEDVYAAYYSPKEMQKVSDSNHGAYFGIGAVVSKTPEKSAIEVVKIYEGSPAEKSGLAVEDEIRKVEETSVEAMGLEDVVRLIQGQKENFSLTVYRPSQEKELILQIECGQVEFDYVYSEMKADQIGYLKLKEFTDVAVTQFQEALLALQKDGMKYLILDLRDNPGGLLDSVCSIADEFLDEEMIVYTENKSGERKEYYSNSGRSVECPVAVLVNESTASASEILVGALQDWSMAKIVGSQTYGKGVVQKTFTLPDGSAFKLTTEKYYTPAGREIQGKGITPDYEITLSENPESNVDTDRVLEEAMALFTANNSDN